MLPSFFVAHGSPMLAVEDNAYTQALGQLGAHLQPKAIVLFSAHWESETQAVSAVEQYRTIHDFGGFPDLLYQIQYPARGDAAITEKIASRLTQYGVPHRLDGSRGLDHGAWVVLRLLYPNAQVPVVAMSVNPALPPAEQYRLGKALAALRADDVLIIGSGGTVHNFATMRLRHDDGKVDAWAVTFDGWLLEKAANWDLDSLFAYETAAPYAQMAVPPHGKEHFIPLFYAMGAADDQRTVREVHRSYRFGNLSHTIWQFGS